MFVIRPSSKHDHLIPFLTIMNRIVWSRFRNIPPCCHLTPFIILKIKFPKIFKKFSLTLSHTTIPTKSQKIVINFNKSMSPSLLRYPLWFISINNGMPLKFFMHQYSIMEINYFTIHHLPSLILFLLLWYFFFIFLPSGLYRILTGSWWCSVECN